VKGFVLALFRTVRQYRLGTTVSNMHKPKPRASLCVFGVKGWGGFPKKMSAVSVNKSGQPSWGPGRGGLANPGPNSWFVPKSVPRPSTGHQQGGHRGVGNKMNDVLGWNDCGVRCALPSGGGGGGKTGKIAFGVGRGRHKHSRTKCPGKFERHKSSVGAGRRGGPQGMERNAIFEGRLRGQSPGPKKSSITTLKAQPQGNLSRTWSSPDRRGPDRYIGGVIPVKRHARPR